MVRLLLRYAGVLWFFVAAELIIMLALSWLLFRPLAGGIGLLDLRFMGFDYDLAGAWVGNLGPQGAETVIVWHYMTFDLVLPTLLGFAFAATILRFGMKLPRFAAMPEWAKLAFVFAMVAPYVIFDYAQNWAVIQMLRHPFEVDPGLVATASALNVAKFASGALPVAVIALFALASKKGARTA